MVTLVNRAKVNTATTGTGTITLGSAVDGYQTFASAGVANGNVVRYVIEDGTDWEIGTGTYAATGSTLTRTVIESSNGGAAISLGGDAFVYVGLLASDIVQVSDVGVTVQAYDANIVSDATYVHTDNNYTTAEKSKLAGVEAGATADQTAAQILTAVKTVDGAASGLDADLLDGLHAASFLQGNQTITLSGDATGSGTTSIVVTVADDSHNHIISNVDGLQTALDGKAPTSHTHTAAQITNFDAEVSNNTSVVANTAKVSNATHTGEVTGSAALTIASNVVDADNLKVTGNGTTSQYLRSDGDGTFTWATPPDTNTTYSVGDGGLTEINFTSADNTKLDGIAAGANNYSFPYTVSQSSTVSTVVQRDSSGDINARLFRSEYDSTNATCNYFMTQVDTVSNNYIRPSTLAQVKAALGGPTAAQVGAATAGLALGAVGTYATLRYQSSGTKTEGLTAAGSTLRYSGSGTSSTSAPTTVYRGQGTAPAGTWRFHGHAQNYGTYYSHSTWLRIS